MQIAHSVDLIGFSTQDFNDSSVVEMDSTTSELFSELFAELFCSLVDRNPPIRNN
jgi:hypothetical protein